MTGRRAFDVALALPASCVALPLMLLAAIAITLTDGRPILFVQKRSGRFSVPFAMFKLRTMTDRRDESGALLPDAMRVTPVGRFLRRSRLDELPALWNILRGDMALVGPRPLLVETVKGFHAAGHLRAVVRPGLTGWAQVNGNTRLTATEKLSLDLWYIANRTAMLDLLILVKTARVMLFGERIGHRHLRRADAYRPDRRG